MANSRPTGTIPPLFATEEIRRAFETQIATRALGRTVTYVQRTSSTNDLAAAAARIGAPHGAVFVADVQDAGRGQRGRQWEAPPGLGLLLSVLVRPAGLDASAYGWLPLLAGVAAVEALRRTTGLDATVKWVNDVVLPAAASPGWRKLGGILCESALPTPDGRGGHAVIGIGLNLNQSTDELPVGAKAPPTSVLVENGHAADRVSVLGALLEELEARLDRLAAPDGRERLRADVQTRLESWWSGRVLQVRAAAPERIVEAPFAGLDSFGRLLLREPGGGTLALADAEVLGLSSDA